MTNASLQSHAETYAACYAALAPHTLSDLSALLADDVLFVDPFNRLTGRAEMTAIFEKMFTQMTDPKFEILDVVSGTNAAYLKWRMTGKVNAAPKMPFDIIGMSEVTFNEAGFVTSHIDHWDSSSQLLSHLPYIGWIVRRISRLFAH